MQRVEVDSGVLYHAINDAINVFVWEVLIPRNHVNAEVYFNDQELIGLQHQIAKQWAEHWKISWKNDVSDTRAR